MPGRGKRRGPGGRFAPDADTSEAKASESRPTIPVPGSAERAAGDRLAREPRSRVRSPEEQREVDRFGSLTRVPWLAIPPEVLVTMQLDATTGFLLSLVDGKTCFEELLDVCAMPHGQALRIYGALRFLGVIDF